MKYLGWVLSFFFFVTGQASAQKVLIDDFHAYTANQLIQKQNSAWSRYGDATSDGINSIDEGFFGRGAAYSVTWTSQDKTGSVRYTFPTPQNLLGTALLTVQLRVGQATLSGTQVTALVGNGATFYEIQPPQNLNSTQYKLFSFDFLGAKAVCVEGSDTLPSVLSAVTSVTLKFSNLKSTGSQTFDFDEIALTSSSLPTSTP